MSATCQRPQTRRLIDKPSFIAVRSGAFDIGGFSIGWQTRAAEVARYDTLLAENAARANEEEGAEREADHEKRQSSGGRLLARRKEPGDGCCRRRPDAPDEHRPEDRATIVARAADDQHSPHLESQHRHVIVWRDEAY